MSKQVNHPETDEMPKDGELSRLYRESSERTPPLALDARILAAAAGAVKSPARVRPLPWWRRWAAPVGVLATMILTVVLVLEMQREQEVLISNPESGAAAPADSLAQKARPQPAVAETVPSAPSIAVPASPPAKVGENTVTSAAGVAAGKLAPEAPVAVSPGNAAPAAAQRSAVPAVAADLAIDAKKEVAPASPAASAPLLKETARSRMEQAPARDAAMEGYVAKPGAAPRLPEPWLADIRRLKAEGRLAEASEQLRRFREAYPDYRLPEDLREPR